jgi:hypothetical protein
MIIAAGDSFVYGSELASPANTFTALLGADECVAWPGYGNDAIARTTIERCEQGGVSGVIVSWTFPGRYEFRFAYDTRQRKSPWYSINAWTIKQDAREIEKEFVTKDKAILDAQLETISRAQTTGVADFARTFYAHVGSTEYWEVYSSLKEIVYLQNYLKVNGIPYMFTCADNSILHNHTVDHGDSVINSLVMQIDMTKWFWFPSGTKPNETCDPRGFYQWAKENKYPIGTTHPLEQAHSDAALLMKEQFNELVKKSVQQNPFGNSLPQETQGIA